MIFFTFYVIFITFYVIFITFSCFTVSIANSRSLFTWSVNILFQDIPRSQVCYCCLVELGGCQVALCVILYTGLYTDYLISSKTLNFEHLNFLVLISIVVVVSNLLLLPCRGLRLPSGTLCDSVQWNIHWLFNFF